MSLWSSRRRKNAAEQEERAWNQNRPADYVSRQKDAMDAVTGQVGSGFDWNTGDEAYQQYRKLSAANAQAGADNARANADLLAGGYGSSYADSVARQGQQQALANIDSALPSLRGQALTEYQNRQSNLLNALSGMASTEALDRSAYGVNLAQYNNWKNFLANQSAQARTAYANDKANVWNWVKNVGEAVLNAYDTYKGFSQQKWQNEFAERQYNDSLARANKSDALSAYEQAFQLYQQGAGDAAQKVLNTYGLDADAFANYTGAPVTRADQANALNAAASLVAAGNNEAAANLLKMYSLDANAAGNYNTIANRQLATALTKAAATKSSGSGRSSRSSGSSGGSGWTNSQLLTALGKYQSLADDDPTKAIYGSILEGAGMLPQTTASPAASGSTTSGTTSNRKKTSSLLQNSDFVPMPTTRTAMAQRQALNWANAGQSDDQIMDRLIRQGLSDDEVYAVLKTLK